LIITLWRLKEIQLFNVAVPLYNPWLFSCKYDTFVTELFLDKRIKYDVTRFSMRAYYIDDLDECFDEI